MTHTLSSLTDDVEALLKDPSNTYFSTDEIQDAIEWCLTEVNRVYHQREDTTIDDVEDTREYSLSSITGLVAVTEVWWPWDASDPTYPPPRVHWFMLDDDTLYLDVDDDPDGTEDLRIFYTKDHTIEGLDGASSTTLDDYACELLAIGAAGRVVLGQGREAIDTINVSVEVAGDWEAWGRGRLEEFRRGLEGLRGREIGRSGDARVSWG